MANTFGDMQNRIALDYLNRTDLGPEIKRAIQNSIKQVESQRYWFNQTATALTASSYIAAPSNFLTLDRLEVTINSADYQLFQRSFDEIRDMNVTRTTGQPTDFAYHGNNFALAIYPDSAYSVICYYIKALPVLALESDSNAWTTEAANYISHCAALDICNTVIIADPSIVQRHANAMRMAKIELDTRNGTRLATRLKSTYF